MYQDQMFMSFTKEEQMMAVPRWGVRLVKEESFQYPEVSVKCPDDVHEIFRPYFEGLDREHFAVLSLDRKRKCSCAAYRQHRWATQQPSPPTRNL